VAFDEVNMLLHPCIIYCKCSLFEALGVNHVRVHLIVRTQYDSAEVVIDLQFVHQLHSIKMINEYFVLSCHKDEALVESNLRDLGRE